MRASPHFLEQILNDIPQPVWVVSSEGILLFTNPAAVHTLGYSHAEELIGKPSHLTVHATYPDGRPYPVEDCPMLAPQRGEVAHGDQEYFIRKDGTYFPITWWSGPLALPDGRGAVLAFRDITETRKLEEELRERRVAEARAAEAEAAQRRILDNEAALRRAIAQDLHDGAQQRLVSLLLELRLASIDVPPEQSEPREALERAMSHARGAIDELRELAAGVHPVVLTQRGLVPALELLASRSPVPVHVAADRVERLPEPVEVCAYYVASEAVTNAFKHAGAKRITVDVTTEHVTHPCVLRMTVRDDGAGGASLEEPGTGLLGMVDRVGALNGAIDVESTPSEGTVVDLCLPITGNPS